MKLKLITRGFFSIDISSKERYLEQYTKHKTSVNSIPLKYDNMPKFI